MLGLGLALTNFGTKGGISDIADGGLLSSTFLSRYGPYGMVMDFSDASISINDSTDVLDYNSQGTVSATTGALLGPGSKLTYTAPSLKLLEQADGYLAFQAHNLYANSAAPANQSVTTGMVTGGTYAITLTGSVSITLSGAATGTVTAGTTTFTAASGTLTCGSTSGSGTVHLRRTPSVSTYVATPTVLGATTGFDLPYVYSGGVKTGVMVEPAATNLCLRSTEFDNASWTKSDTTVTANAITAPDGTLTADKVVESATTANHYIAQSITTTAAAHTFSAYLKQGERRYAFVYHQQTTAGRIFDLQTGALGGTAGLVAPTTSTITALPNGWYRCDITVTATAAANSFRIYISTDGTTLNYAGDGTSGVYAWGADVELGTVATSPIITYGSSVLRAADDITMAVTLFPFTAATSTVYAYADLNQSVTNPRSVAISNGASERYVELFGGASFLQLAYSAGGTGPSSLGTASGSPARAAIALAANDGAGCVDGGSITADATVTVTQVPTTLYVGRYGGNSNWCNGLIKQLAYFPERKANATLQTMTTA